MYAMYVFHTSNLSDFIESSVSYMCLCSSINFYGCLSFYETMSLYRLSQCYDVYEGLSISRLGLWVLQKGEETMMLLVLCKL